MTLTIAPIAVQVIKCRASGCLERIGTLLARDRFRVTLHRQTMLFRGPGSVELTCERGHWNDIQLTVVESAG